MKTISHPVKRIIGLVLPLCLLFILEGYSQQQRQVLFTINDSPVYTDEFLYLYTKNYQDSASIFSRESLREYLDLFIAYKLKVTEAIAKGYEQHPTFQQEFETYREQLTKPYLTDRATTERLVKEAYERMQEEVKASHILVSLPESPTPADTLEAYRKIMAIRERIMQGEDFGQVAFQVSEDPSAKQYKGSLGYFTALQMVYEFEDASYRLPIGQVSMPVRTRFGYHLLSVQERRKAWGAYRAAHIMIRANNAASAEDSLLAVKKITEIKQRLNNGEDWGALCARFSEDGATRDKQGELAVFTAGTTLPEFSEAVYHLEPGEVSAPVRTPFGWHLIRLIEKRPVAPFSEMETQIRRKVARDSRSQLSDISFLKMVKQENAFKDYPKNQQKAFARLDAALLEGKWTLPAKPFKPTLPVFEVKGRKFTLKDYYEYILTAQQAQTEDIALKRYAATLYQAFEASSLIQYAKAQLPVKHPEYVFLVNEYREGLLLFAILEDEIWGRAMKDSMGLEAYFDANRDKYRWKPRMQTTVITASNPRVLDQMLAELPKGFYPVGDVDAFSLKFQPKRTEWGNENLAIVDELVRLLQVHPDYRLKLSGTFTAGEPRGIVAQRLEKVRVYLETKHLSDRIVGFESAGRAPSARKNPGISEVFLEVFSTSIADLAMEFNRVDPLAISWVKKTVEQGEEGIFTQVPWRQGIHRVPGNPLQAVWVESIAPEGYKSLDEVKGLVISDYQQVLEKEWVEKLKLKYKVVLADDVFAGLVK